MRKNLLAVRLAWALLLFVSLPGLAHGTPVAFPGAEGEGRLVSGGRGGDVYHVTTLNDAGPGSLRNGLDTASGAPRTVVFDVGGTISLLSGLSVSNGNITIAGETAPGQGICVTQYGLDINSNNVILRDIRVRPGDAQKGPTGFTGDAISINASNVIVDHCSTSWGIDENLSVAGRGAHGVTVQYCTISQGLDQTGLYHGELNADYNPGGSGHHSMGSLIKPLSGNGVITYSHNLWSDNGNRNPAVGTYTTSQTLKVDLRNNVMYNNRSYGYSSGDSKEVDMNYVGNYIIIGPDTKFSSASIAFLADANNHMHIFQSGNKFDGNGNVARDGIDYGWQVIVGDYTKSTSAFSMAPVTTDTADVAYQKVLSGAGAFPWNRDSVDQRFVNEVIQQQGSIVNSQNDVGGYPTLPTLSRPANWDTDHDGMPDWWEDKTPGLNRLVPDQNGLNPDGYTNLEEYLHYAANVPEPSTILLLIPGLLALLCLRRRRARRSVLRGR